MKITDSTRQFWVSGLNDVSGRLSQGLSNWVLSGDYQIISPLEPNSFILNVAMSGPSLGALAYDCNRLGMAAIETIITVSHDSHSEKAMSWPIIRAYYSAFFAAQAIMRMLGTAFVHFNQSHVSRIRSIADAYQSVQQPQLSAGYYCAKFKPNSGEISFNRSSGRGAHEQSWHYFIDLLNGVINRLLQSDLGVQHRDAALKLSELTDTLGQSAGRHSSWLSMVRNEVNYKQLRGVWFPYEGKSRRAAEILGILQQWSKDPMAIQIRYGQGQDLQSFAAICTFLVSVCGEMSEDMARRCSVGPSFLDFGILRFIKTFQKSCR